MSPRRRRRRTEEATPLGRKALMLGLAALALTAVLGSLFGERGYLEVRRYQKTRRAVAAEIEALEADITRLHREIVALREDPQAMERIAREELILARPGEVVFLFPRDERDEGEARTIESPRRDAPGSP